MKPQVHQWELIAVSWKYCSQTTNHGGKISQNKAIASEIVPTTWVKNMALKIADQHNMKWLLSKERNVVLKKITYSIS